MRSPKRTSRPRRPFYHYAGCLALLLWSLAYLLVRYLSDWDHWGFVFVEYAGPVFFFLALLCLLLAGLTRSRARAVMGLLAALVWWHSVSGLWRPGWGGANASAREDVTVLSYNVAGFGYGVQNARQRQALAESILRYPADVLCLQEFTANFRQGKSFSETEFARYLQQLGLYGFAPHPRSGFPAVLSRFPIIGSGEVYIPQYTSTGNGIVYADLQTPGGTLRVYSVHIGTLKRLWDARQRLRKTRQGTLIGAWVRLAKAKHGQLALLLESLRRSPYPAIVCGDFNEPPFGYVYQKLRRSLDNAFEEKGAGLGGTSNKTDRKTHLVRIDNIFVHPDIEVLDFQTLHGVKKSDHFPVMARLRLPGTGQVR